MTNTIGRAARRMAHLATLLLAVASLGGLAAASQDVRVSARLGQGVLKLGDDTSLVVTVEGAGSARLLELPKVEGLELGPVAGPSLRQSSTLIGGRLTVERTLTFSVGVRAASEGDFEVPAIGVEVDGAVYRTAPQPLTVQADLLGAELGFIELRGLTDRIVEGQPIEVDLVFGWDRDIESATNYANLLLPWWDNLPGALLQELPRRGARRDVEVILNRRSNLVVGEMADELVGGKPFRVFKVQLELLPVRSGVLELPTSFLQFGTLQRGSFFEESRLTRSYFAEAPQFKLEVEPLPTEGQPFDYTGAIGQMSVRAQADTRDVRVGDSIKLTVEWIGNGNLDYFEPPDPSRQPGFEGFRFFGTTGEKLSGRRRVVYDLAPLDSTVTEIPSLELPVFDTETWSYRRLATEPIPIRVRALEGVGLDGEEAPRFVEDLRDIEAEAVIDGGAATSAPGLRTVSGALVGVILCWFALRSAVRQGGRDPSSIDERRRRRALRLLERELRTSLDSETDLRAWAGFLGARTREEAEAWFGRDPREVFGPHGERPLPADTVDALVRMNRDLESAVFGDGERVPRQELIGTARDLLGDGL
ncbi:BatD family protein [Engelhardtia mirabilis]